MRVLAWIETGPEGHDLSCLRLDEIGIGHESQMLVALSQVPLVADLEEVLAVPQFYWGPDGFGLLSRMPRATHKGIQALQAASAEQGSSHGLSWRTVGPGDDLATLRWFDLDARSLYLAAEILSGRLVAADEDERELARAWRRHGRRRAPPRPPKGIREEPARAEERGFVDALRSELASVGGAPERWGRVGEERRLTDGSVLAVERDGSDGGFYAGRYVLSRYRSRTGDEGWAERLLERTYL